MIYQMYSIRDKAVGAFLQPLFFRSKGEAIRAFTDACHDGKSNFCQHPNDYTMFFIGEFDDGSGAFVPLPSPEKVIEAFECVKTVDN